MLNSLSAAILSVVLLFSLAAEASTEDWPPKVVKFEELRATKKFRLFVPEIVVKGRVSGPSIIKAHIAIDGSVARTALISSCGNPGLDEASLHAIREMQFEPYIENDEPTDVSLVVPIHIPKNWGRRD